MGFDNIVGDLTQAGVAHLPLPPPPGLPRRAAGHVQCHGSTGKASFKSSVRFLQPLHVMLEILDLCDRRELRKKTI